MGRVWSWRHAPRAIGRRDLAAHEKGAMSQESEDDDLEPEYDFSGAVRGKYYQRYQQTFEWEDGDALGRP